MGIIFLKSTSFLLLYFIYFVLRLFVLFFLFFSFLWGDWIQDENSSVQFYIASLACCCLFPLKFNTAFLCLHSNSLLPLLLIFFFFLSSFHHTPLQHHYIFICSSVSVLCPMILLFPLPFKIKELLDNHFQGFSTNFLGLLGEHSRSLLSKCQCELQW